MKRWSGLRARLHELSDLRLLALLLAALCALLALKQPQLQLTRSVYSYVFVLDVTESMNVADVGPERGRLTRIAYARQAIAAALQQLGCGSQAGLAVFAERRALLLFAPVEICEHYGVILSLLDRLDWRVAWRGGSEIAHGLDSAMHMTHALGADTRLVFLTDGHEAPPVHPQLRMHLDEDAGQSMGLIVGIGGDTPVPIPVLDEEGKLTGYWSADQVQQVDSYSLGRTGTEAGEHMTGIDAGDVQRRIAQGTEHLSSLHEVYLQQLAREAQLDYLRLHAPEQLSQALLRRRYAHAQAVPTDLSWLLALIALACAVVATLAPAFESFLRASSHSSRRRRARV